MKITFTWARVGIIAGAVAGVLTAILTYVQLDWPLPASAKSVMDAKAFAITADEKVVIRVAAQETYSKGTRALLLNDKWFRTNAELQNAKERLREDPTNDDLRFAIQLLEDQLRLIREQINELR
jgi:hypothetical protein